MVNRQKKKTPPLFLKRAHLKIQLILAACVVKSKIGQNFTNLIDALMHFIYVTILLALSRAVQRSVYLLPWLKFELLKKYKKAANPLM